MPESRIQQWKSRPVFLSSTFRDMHAERDHLRQHVFPRLEEELKPDFDRSIVNGSVRKGEAYSVFSKSA